MAGAELGVVIVVVVVVVVAPTVRWSTTWRTPIVSFASVTAVRRAASVETLPERVTMF